MALRPTETLEQRPRRRAGYVAVLLLLVLMGVVLRAHHLGRESVWYDEYNSVRYLDAPSLTTFLYDQREENNVMMPLYFVVQYYWAWLTGGSVVALRWLSIVFGVLCIPLLYRFGRVVNSPHTGLLAASCVALSPFHIFHAQGLRPYSLMTLLALLSAYAFLGMLGSGRPKWWALNTAANLLLMWTHVFGLWLLAAEALFLFLFRRREARRILWWAACHVLLLMPVALFVWTWQFRPPADIPLPGLGSMLHHILGKDGERTAWIVHRLLDPALPDLGLSNPVRFLMRSFAGLDFALQMLLAAAGGLMVLNMLRQAPTRPDGRRGNVEHLVFLLFWLVLPALLLSGFAYVFSSGTFQCRYTMHSSLALYLMAGAGIAGIRRLPVRSAASALLIALFGCQTVLADSLPLRPDFLGAARYIGQHAAADTPILFYPALTRKTFCYNLAKPERAVAECDELAEVFGWLDERLETSSAWVVLAEIGRPLDIATFERYADLCGMSWSRRVFPGVNCLFVYACSRRDPGQSLEAPTIRHALREAIMRDPDDIPLRLVYGKALARAGLADEKIQQLEEVLDLLPTEPPPSAGLLEAFEVRGFLGSLEAEDYVARLAAETTRAFCQALADAGRQGEAIQAYQTGLRRCPDDPQLPLEFVHALLRFGRCDEAHETSLLAIERFPRDYMLRIALGETQECMGRDEEAVATYRCSIAMDPEKPYAYTQLGLVSLRMMNYGEAVGALRAAVDIHAKEDDPAQLSREALIRTYCAIEDYAAAWNAVAECRARGIEVPAELLSKLVRDSGREPAAAPD